MKDIQRAYIRRIVTADEVKAMAYYITHHLSEEGAEDTVEMLAEKLAENMAEKLPRYKDERSDKEKRTKKEINKKGERTHTHQKKSQKSSFFPSFDEVEEHGLKLGATQEQIDKFYHFYDSMEWRIGDKEMINWRSRLKLWLADDKYKLDQLKQQDDEKRRQTQGAGAQNGATREELQQAIIDYLDTHYPVADKSVEYVVAHGMGRDAKLGDMAARLGTAPVLRLVTKKLFVTGYEMDLKPSMLRPQTLDKMTKRLCEKAWLLTMRQVEDFLQRCMDGVYGDFRGGLKTTTVLPALKKFMLCN